ncbi:hypothetical protein A1O3_03983 [Capronia epimyces CBS 606.96]|uniref:Transcription factor domain-containing protein n=1 Tax=Capronia epimyces CBS 606.96 TaxID=1182542 RepID=W9YCQ1_9EURO|nr:uncharacterized protein A1O3_03983 [Capronia epimyces CBS 606.96]EXJ87026.1 hypothetical protein A1O3_03983 [Capronia epimyces CBS 606.96]
MTFHVRLPMSSPVAQQNATYILQMIRPFPNMMTRKDTLPPFIHHSLGSTDSGLAFPEPLANCMSIARMFVWRTSETREFVWETIWSEQRKLADKAASYTPEDLLASLQACNIYVIMRMVDYSPEHAEKDLETMLWCYRISDRLINSLDGEFGVSEHDRPNQMWKDWIFVESQRRYLSVWFLLTRLISMRTGIGCPYVDAYLSLPLPAPRSLWEAASAEAWKAEYDCTYTTPELPRLRTFGELVEAQKPTNYTQFMHKLDLWNADADSLGMMLTLATAIMK